MTDRTAAAPRLVVVTLNWNGADDTIACLDSIESSRPEDVEVIVVDNGSNDEDVLRVVQATFSRKWVTLVRNPENLGFTGGSNIGITIALERGASAVMLLNNDARVERGAFATLLDYLAASPEAGLVSPLILDESGDRIWAAGGVRARREVVCRLGLARRPVAEAPTSPFSSYALIGCAIVVRAEVIERVGQLDNDYFAYLEDIDYSVRVREAGWRLDVVPAARVRHRVSGASGGGYTPLRSYLLGRGTALFVRKRGALDQRLGFAIAAPLGLLAALVREVPRGNGAAVVAKLRGYIDGLLARRVDARYLRR
ncbi:MAG: glycosyltransferase family 2 protein [Blastocatellia bacterium]|jgi:GT2 family glycosyltransferase|nr:glycosyltransferase family 2 protein [Blastocatellia bacterium]